MRRVVSRILAGSLIVSLLAGVAWAFIVRPMRFLVVEDGMGQSLDGESSNEFAALGWVALISAGVGLVIAIAAWSARRYRGIGLLAWIVGICALGSLTMAAVGELVVRLRYPIVDNPNMGTIVSFAPKIFDGTIPVVLTIEPLVAALAIFVMTALSPFDDLGTERGVEPTRLGVPAGSTSV